MAASLVRALGMGDLLGWERRVPVALRCDRFGAVFECPRRSLASRLFAQAAVFSAGVAWLALSSSSANRSAAARARARSCRMSAARWRPVWMRVLGMA